MIEPLKEPCRTAGCHYSKGVELVAALRAVLAQTREDERKAVRDYSVIITALRADRDALAVALQQLVDEITDALLSTFGDSAASPLGNELAIKNARAALKQHGGKP